jgi:hypothetical protein
MAKELYGHITCSYHPPMRREPLPPAVSQSSRISLGAMMFSSQHLCRICEFPAAESGVRVDAFDAEKLTEWCKRKLGA